MDIPEMLHGNPNQARLRNCKFCIGRSIKTETTAPWIAIIGPRDIDLRGAPFLQRNQPDWSFPAPAWRGVTIAPWSARADRQPGYPDDK